MCTYYMFTVYTNFYCIICSRNVFRVCGFRGIRENSNIESFTFFYAGEAVEELQTPRWGYVVFALLAGISAGIGSATYRLTGLRGVWGIGVQSLSQALNQSLEVQNHDALIFAIGIWAASTSGCCGINDRILRDTKDVWVCVCVCFFLGR